MVFPSGDDDGAAAEIAALAEKLGFSPIQLGGLAEGGLLAVRGHSAGSSLTFGHGLGNSQFFTAEITPECST